MTDRASAREVWRETRPLTRPVQRLYLVAAAAVIVSTLITLAGPALVRYAVDNGIVKHDLHPLNVAAVALQEDWVDRHYKVCVRGLEQQLVATQLLFEHLVPHSQDVSG